MKHLLFWLWNIIPDFIRNIIKFFVVIGKDKNLLGTRTFGVIKHFPISNIISNYIVLGKGVRISGKNNFFGKIKIGDYSYIAGNCLILGSYNYGVTIGKFCSIASGVLFLAYNDHNASKLTTYPPYSGSVVLGRDEEVGSDIYI